MSETTSVEPKKKFQFRLPHVYTIAFLLIVLFAVLTWIVPSGQFDREVIEVAGSEREVAVAGTYQEVPKVYTDEETGETVDLRQGVPQVLQAFTLGIQGAADVVAFVLLIGGAFAIINKTDAINAGLSRVARKLKDKDVLIIPVTMTPRRRCRSTPSSSPS